jgi:transposase, IS30 family
MATHHSLAAVQRQFWGLIAAGVSSVEAGRAVGVSDTCGVTWFRKFGGVNPRMQLAQGVKRPRLSLLERERIMIGTSQGESIRSIARGLGRAPSTVMREIDKNGRTREAPGRYRALHRFGANRGGWDARSGYSATLAQQRTEARARRPKTGKLGRCPALRAQVQALLTTKYSPEQIAGVLATTYPDRPEMQVSHETIYKALYVQGRGELRRELTTCLRTGRALRKPRRRPRGGDGRGRIPGMVNISERPAEADDRAVPGHWEGDLIIGKDQASQIGTLVERSTGFVRLLHLPDTRSADVVADAMIAAIKELPPTLRRTVTWDQGHEMAQHARISVDAGIEVYFCDPHSPWQRGSNENTNGLLRQYFPKGTDLSVHSAEHLAHVADELNGRPRKRFNWDNPTNRVNQLLLSPPAESTVATKP